MMPTQQTIIMINNAHTRDLDTSHPHANVKNNNKQTNTQTNGIIHAFGSNAHEEVKANSTDRGWLGEIMPIMQM